MYTYNIIQLRGSCKLEVETARGCDNVVALKYSVYLYTHVYTYLQLYVHHRGSALTERAAIIATSKRTEVSLQSRAGDAAWGLQRGNEIEIIIYVHYMYTGRFARHKIIKFFRFHLVD